MGYEYDSDQGSSIFARLSGKKLAALAILIIIGGVFAVQALFGFPIRDLFRKEITDGAKVIIKDQQGTCVVEGSDSQPRGIPNCPYRVGDTLVVTFKEGTAPIEKHHLKTN
jgi:hypothetical protein